MNRTELIEKEFVSAIRMYPGNADLYNDYAVFLSKYKNDYKTAVKLLEKAIRINPKNRIFQYNYNRIIKRAEVKFNYYHNFLVLVIAGIMVWLGYMGYSNIMNMVSLFVVAQIIMNYPKVKSPLW